MSITEREISVKNMLITSDLESKTSTAVDLGNDPTFPVAAINEKHVLYNINKKIVLQEN